MSTLTDVQGSSREREELSERLRLSEFRRGLRAVRERYNFLPDSEHEVEAIKTIERMGSTLRYLDRVERSAYAKHESNEAARKATSNAAEAFRTRYDGAVAAIDHAHLMIAYLKGASGSFAELFPRAEWSSESDLRAALVDLARFAELNNFADEDDLSEGELPIPFSGMTHDEATEKITETLGVMTARGLRSTALALEGSEHLRMHYWGQRLLEANQHAYARNATTEELSAIASTLLLTK
jgi:hypothetical protein